MNYLDQAASETFALLLVNLEQEESRLLAVASLLTDVSTKGVDDPKMRSRMAAAEKLGVAIAGDRLKLLLELGHSMNVPSDHITLTMLIAVAPPEISAQLRAAQKRLRILIRRIQRLLATTTVIVNESLRLYHTVLGGLFGASSSDRYNASGTQSVDFSYGSRMEARS